jgi:hypothetical protein
VTVPIRSQCNRDLTNGLPDAATFYVKDGPFFESMQMPPDSEVKVLVDHRWELEGE